MRQTFDGTQETPSREIRRASCGARSKDTKRLGVVLVGLWRYCPAAAAQAFIAGQNDVAMTYEPYLSAVREKPEAGKIIATTLDYPMVMDTFGCTPKFISENEAAVKALVKSYFDAIETIKTDQKKAYEIMGADVKQTGEQFGNSAKYLRWQDRVANRTFFTGEFKTFNKEAADLLLEIGVIKQIPDLEKIADTRFIQ
jgi:NitT/TauT family transport system substrate-binding protein